jgi:hypothetical protein
VFSAGVAASTSRAAGPCAAGGTSAPLIRDHAHANANAATSQRRGCALPGRLALGRQGRRIRLDGSLVVGVLLRPNRAGHRGNLGGVRVQRLVVRVEGLLCTCGTRLRSALATVAAEGRGVVVYLRGTGMCARFRQPPLLREGSATNHDAGAAILRDLGVRSMRSSVDSRGAGAAAG